MNSEIVFIGKTNFRNKLVKFGIKSLDRRQHMYIIGKSGTGKSTLLENMVIADIAAGRGVAVVDPHGELAEKILDFIPEERIDDVVYLNSGDLDYPIAFNPLESVSIEARHLVASGIMGVFKKIWPDVWSARMEYILNNTLLSLLEFPSSTLLEIMRMLSDREFRKGIVDNLQDPVIKSFWTNEFARYTQKLETEAVSAIQNKVGQFISNPLIRNIVGQPKSAIDMRKIMDEKKILIVNLSKGRIGEDNSALLGAMIITKIYLAAMSRVDVSQSERKDFYLYVDEFQNFSTESFANILSEARKYRLNLILAHQYIEQLKEEVRWAISGNVGTRICFRVGPTDAEYLETEFSPPFLATDLVNLANFNVYIKMLVDGIASKAFSAETLPPVQEPETSFRDVIVENSRNKYGVKRIFVEETIAKGWTNADSEEAAENITQRRGEQSLETMLKPAPIEPRENPKKEREHKEVNIDDLKRAIERSLEYGGEENKEIDDETEKI